MGRLSWLALALALASCEYKVTQYPQAPPMTVRGTATEIRLRIIWVPGVDALDTLCGRAPGQIVEGCALHVPDPHDPKAATCLLYAIQPKDFNDVALVAILGHEVMHCSGDRH